MSEAYFWRIAGKWSAPAHIAVLKENPDLFEGQPRNTRIIYKNDLETDTTAVYNAYPGSTGKALALNKDKDNSPVYRFAFDGKGAKWIRGRATVHCIDKEYEGSKMAQFVIRVTSNGKVVKERMIRVYRLLDNNETRDVTIDMKLPATPFDSVSLLFWNSGSDKPLWVSNLQVEAFDE
jgi:hypothetical protein